MLISIFNNGLLNLKYKNSKPFAVRSNEISEDLVLICDYTKRDKNENFMIPELLEKPESILNIVIKAKKVDYLIFK